MTNRPKQIGTAGESGVVAFLRPNGFPGAERRALKGTHDEGDITGTPALTWEVKAGKAAQQAGDLQIAAWLGQTETERVNAGADVGVLVVARSGYGPRRAGHWWAIVPRWQMARLLGAPSFPAPPTFPVRMLLADLVLVLREAGYGTPPEQEEPAA
ncbi:hypothetical protein SMC26_40420 [Actinomadura fulvescens]|uniref:Holliday junction resolvase n=1 Tax=Actinomadura fulvescens TaxID=46160 RepID=A0ABN3Q7K6_9ACTN